MSDVLISQISEGVETSKLTHKAKLLSQFLEKLPEGLRSEVENYVKIVPIVKIYCENVETGRVEDVTDAYDEMRWYYGSELDKYYRNCKNYIAGYRVEGKLPFEVMQKHNFFVDYVDKELIRQLFFENLIELPSKVFVKITHRSLGLNRHIVYEDETVTVVEETFYDYAFSSYYIYTKIHIPQIDLTLFRFERGYENIPWDRFKEKEPELARKIEEFERKREEERKRREWFEALEKLKKEGRKPWCYLIWEFFSEVDDETKKLIINSCKREIEEEIEKLRKGLERGYKEFDDVVTSTFIPIERCAKCPIYQHVKELINELNKVIEEARKWNEKVKEVRKKLEEEAKKALKNEYRRIKEELSKLPVTVIKDKFDEDFREFEIVVKIGNGKWLKREEFNRVITKLKELKFKFNPKEKTWNVYIKVRINMKNRKFYLNNVERKESYYERPDYE